MQPYLLAFCEEKPNGLTRSVLTAVARVSAKQTLFATCKHVVTQMDRVFVVDENGTPLAEKWAIIPTTEVDLDLCFLLIPQSVPANRMKISEFPIEREIELSHARNRVMESTEASPFAVHTATTRRSPFRAEFGFSIADGDLRYRFIKNEADVVEARRGGTKTFYPVLEMESWTGVSGSALWDKHGFIRGIVCGGGVEDDIPRLVYIPARTLKKEVGSLLKNPDFQRRAQLQAQ